MKEDWNRKAYGPSTAKTYETSLFNLITTEFGYIGGPDIIRLFAQKIVELNDRYYLRGDFILGTCINCTFYWQNQTDNTSKQERESLLIPMFQKFEKTQFVGV
jgi:hypothetical protein